MSVEPDVKDFLVRVLQSLSMAMLWLLVNMTLGIYFNFAFFEDEPSLGNYIFYAWFLISLGLLIFYYVKKWRERLSK
ncbi:MAG: hypothetical protein V4556_04215 [Bacteroidota bacterium]